MAKNPDFKSFLSDENRRLLSWLGGALAAVAIGLWSIFVYFDQRGSVKAEKSRAGNAGIIVGHDAVDSTLVNH